jgi:hypothetical protein
MCPISEMWREAAMRPVPIETDEEIDGMAHVILTPPGGDPNDAIIGSIDALVSGANPETGLRAFVSKWELEDGELFKLADTGYVWVTVFASRHPVIAMEAREKGEGYEPTA